MTDSEIDTGAPHGESAHLRAAQVNQLYSQSRAGLLGAQVSALILPIALWNATPLWRVGLWLAVYFALQIPRNRLVREFHKRPRLGPEARVWGNLFAAVTIASGFTWGMAGVFLFPENSEFQQFLLALFLAGISAAASVVYAPLKECYLPTVVVEVAPISCRCFYEGDWLHVLMGVVMLVFLAVLLVTGRHVHNINRESLMLRFEKNDLIESLTRQKTVAEDLNAHLTAEMAERELAQKALAESEAKYRLLVDSAQEGIFVAQDGMLKFVNPRLIEITGLSEEELLREPFAKLIHPDDREGMMAVRDRITRGEESPSRYSFRIVNPYAGVFWIELDTVFIEWEGAPAGLCFATDVTERKAAEDALKESEANYRTIFDAANDAIAILEPATGRIVDANSRVSDLLGVIPDQIQGRTLEVFTSGSATTEDGDYRAWPLSPGEIDQRLVEWRIEGRDGEEIWIEASRKQTVIGGQERILAVIRDVTKRKEAEDQIKRSLKEKEVLLREIHHRVKNNLQVMSSLMRLQSRHVRDTGYQAIFKESENRLRSMALVHEKLYQSETLAKLPVGNYISGVLDQVARTYGVVGSRVKLKTEIENIDIGVDTAIPLGFIVTELYSNCLKHAFPDTRRGSVRVVLRSAEAGRLELIVSDDGVGLPENMPTDGESSLGLKLVRIFTQQIRGTMTVDGKDGAEFRIVFRPAPRSKRS